MEFLESVGMLAILGVVVVLIIQYLNSQGHETVRPENVKGRMNLESSKNNNLIYSSRENEEIGLIKERIKEKHPRIPDKIEYKALIQHSNKCQELIWARNRAVADQIPCMSIEALHREFRKVLKEPLEYWSALEKYYKKIDYENLQKVFRKIQTEYYIKYCEVAFSVFDTLIYLSKENIISRIKRKLKITKINAEGIFEIWKEYQLIDQSYNSDENKMIDQYKLNYFLENGQYESSVKISRKEWLDRNNKKLVEVQSNIEDDNDLPF